MYYQFQNSGLLLCLIYLNAHLYDTVSNKDYGKGTTQNEIKLMIVGGIPTQITEYPFMVSLRVNSRYVCAGIILDSNKILTVAHCFRPSIPHSLYSIHCGKSKKYGNEPNEKLLSIKSVIIHEGFVREDGLRDAFKYDNDIAIVKLNESLKFTENITNAVLPKYNENLTPGTYCCVAGWGDTNDGGDQNNLNEICIPTWNRIKCNMKQFHNSKISPNMICAGEEAGGVDACQGDSGGALFCTTTSGKKVSGLVSWGKGCAESDKPGVYVDLSKYIKWIERNSKKL